MNKMMEQNIKYTKYLGVKAFSNKWYSIHVILFDHGMARVGMRYKKRKNRRQLWCSFLTFDECRRESVYDTWDCLHFLQMDKTARKWFRKVLHPCFEKYLLPNGIISSEIAEEVESQERQQHAYRLPRMEEEVDRVLWWYK